MTHLSDPIAIKNLNLPNRLVMPPMATAKADESGHVTDEVCSYYQERAKHSKIGLIITEHSYIHLQGKAHPGQTSMASDDVELHSAHGYLLNQFFSPLANRRTDGYGPQTVENRVRFHREVILAVRQAVGEDFPIALRLGGCDYEAGGSTVEDCVEACRLLEHSGVDLLHLTGGMNGFVRPGHGEPGYFRDLSVPVKGAVHIPVLLTGGVTTPAQAEALLEEGCADLIGVGRAIFKNARWAD